MKKEKVERIILIGALIFLVLTGIFIKPFLDSQEQHYVSGKFYVIKYVHRSGKMAFYEYEFEGKRYTGAVKYTINKERIDFDQFYYVKVPDGFPGEGTILLDSLVLD